MSMFEKMMSRRSFIKQGSQLLALMVSSRFGVETALDVAQGPSENLPYGSGVYGQGIYPGHSHQIYLPLIKKESN